MEIYIASFAGLLSSLLLAVVYLADRYEPEPIEMIQDSFLTGLAGQLMLVFAVSSVAGGMLWSDWWLVVTVVAAAVYLPFGLHRQGEVDERFDGIVYSVATLGGATCAIHLNNLPRVMVGSPYRDALAPGAEPDLRDLLILAGSPGFSAELGRGFVVILAAVFVGALVGVLKLRAWPPWRTAMVSSAVAVAVVGGDLATGGNWWVRGALATAALGMAVMVIRRSVFRDRPEPRERDVVLMGLKTILIVFGAALLATVLLQAVVDQPRVEENSDRVDHHTIKESAASSP